MEWKNRAGTAMETGVISTTRIGRQKAVARPNDKKAPGTRPFTVNNRNMVSVPIQRTTTNSRGQTRPLLAPVAMSGLQKSSMVKIENTQEGRRIVHCAVAPKAPGTQTGDGLKKVITTTTMTTNYPRRIEPKIHHSRDIMNKITLNNIYNNATNNLNNTYNNTSGVASRSYIAKPLPTAKQVLPVNVVSYPSISRKPTSAISEFNGKSYYEELKMTNSLNSLAPVKSAIVEVQGPMEESFLNLKVLKKRIKRITYEAGMLDAPPEVAELLSQACEEHLTTLVEKLCIVSEHRQDNLRMEQAYQQTSNPRAQLEFFKEVEEVREKNILEFEDLNEARDRMEKAQKHRLEKQYRQDTEVTAMQAILGTKKPKLDESKANQMGPATIPALTIKRRKFITKTDILFTLSQEKSYRNFLHMRYMS